MTNGHAYTLITGACGGLGKAFAFECAKRGQNLILVDLHAADPELLARYLSNNYSIDALAIACNLVEEEQCLQLLEDVKKRKLQVNTLINNAGLSTNLMFEEGSLSFFQYAVKLNVLSVTTLTHLFLPLLKESKPAYLLNVGSIGGFFALPRKQVYNASKAYIDKFTRSLRRELAADGISVSLLCPGGMNTNHTATLFNMSGSWFYRQTIMNAEEVAAIAIRDMLRGKELIIPGKGNRMLLLLDKLLPTALKDYISQKQLKSLSKDNPFIQHYAPITQQQS